MSSIKHIQNQQTSTPLETDLQIGGAAVAAISAIVIGTLFAVQLAGVFPHVSGIILYAPPGSTLLAGAGVVSIATYLKTKNSFYISVDVQEDIEDVSDHDFLALLNIVSPLKVDDKLTSTRKTFRLIEIENGQPLYFVKIASPVAAGNRISCKKLDKINLESCVNEYFSYLLSKDLCFESVPLIDIVQDVNDVRNSLIGDFFPSAFFEVLQELQSAGENKRPFIIQEAVSSSEVSIRKFEMEESTESYQEAMLLNLILGRTDATLPNSIVYANNDKLEVREIDNEHIGTTIKDMFNRALRFKAMGLTWLFSSASAKKRIEDSVRIKILNYRKQNLISLRKKLQSKGFEFTDNKFTNICSNFETIQKIIGKNRRITPQDLCQILDSNLDEDFFQSLDPNNLDW